MCTGVACHATCSASLHTLYSPGVTEGRNHDEVDSCIGDHTHHQTYHYIGWNGHCPVPTVSIEHPDHLVRMERKDEGGGESGP